MLWLDCAVFRQGGFSLSADLRIEDGALVAVLGPSGAGKSTFLHGIAGFVPLTSGRVLWGDVDIGQAAPDKRPVSILFQDNNLFPHLSVLQNVALALAPRLNPRAGDRERVEEMLDQVGLAGLSGRKPSDLSGGQQSRVALARALLQDRPVLLLDEPFGALGPALKSEMLDLTVRLAEGRTVVMITHDPQDAAQVAESVVGVVSGRVSEPVATEDFLANPPDEIRDYFGDTQ